MAQVSEVRICVDAIPPQGFGLRTIRLCYWIDPIYPLSFALELAQEDMAGIRGRMHNVETLPGGAAPDYLLVIVPGPVGLRYT